MTSSYPDGVPAGAVSAGTAAAVSSAAAAGAAPDVPAGAEGSDTITWRVSAACSATTRVTTSPSILCSSSRKPYSSNREHSMLIRRGTPLV